MSGPGPANAQRVGPATGAAVDDGSANRDADNRGAASGARARAEGPDPLIGTKLAHFRIDAALGRGGMGAVYRGWDCALDRPVAIKVLTATHPAARERFLREARAQAKVRHPNVVPIHYVGSEGETDFLSMDLVEGTALSDRLRDGPMGVDVALDIADAVGRALEEGYKNGLIHRDVKPSNILCTDDQRVLLADFGLAKSVSGPEPQRPDDPTAEAPTLTRAGVIVGTPAYMAPEQTSSSKLDHRADMYALGVTLYEMLTGQLPFTADTPAALLAQHREEEPLAPAVLNPSLPPAVDTLVRRLMAKEPEARFADYGSLREAIAVARVRSAPSAGFFVRGGALSIDLFLSAVLALLVSQLHTALSWLAVVALWSFAEARWAKTVGKRLFVLRVVEAHEQPPQTVRAVWRNVIKYWGPVVASFVVAFVVDDAIQDPIALTVLGVWGMGLGLALGRAKRALHDRLSATRVVYDVGG